MTLVTPLIICGGSGTRLWPVSRKQSPKQFQRMEGSGSQSFFQSAVERHCGKGYDTPLIVSSFMHSKVLAEQLSEIDQEAQIIYEPMGRNTGPAVLAAAIRLYAQNPEALMVVVPADHIIDGDLNSTIMAMVEPAKAGQIITFGIKPRYAETGFGYITDGGPIIKYPGLHQVERFVEKPPRRKARLLVESDLAYWASGLSMFSARTIIAEYTKYDPNTVEAVKLAVSSGEFRDNGLLLNEEHFARATSDSTESMVFEKSSHIALAPLDVQWSDVGSWTAMYGISKANHQGNVLHGDVIAVESTNSMVRSSSRLVTLVGVSDIIVVDTPDALLVTKVGQCQNVKRVAEFLKAEHRVEVEKHASNQAVVEVLVSTRVSQIIKTDAIDMISVEIQPGESMELDAYEKRDILVVSGGVVVSEKGVRTSLDEGHRMDLINESPIVLTNQSKVTATVVLTACLNHADDKVPQPIPLYA